MTLTEVSFINVCHPSITHMYINPPLLSIEATSIQMSKRDPSHIHSCRCVCVRVRGNLSLVPLDRCLHHAQAPRPRSTEVSCLQRRLPSRLHGLHRFDQHQCRPTRPHEGHVCSRRLLPRHLNGPLHLDRIWPPESLQGTSCLRRRWQCSYPS